MKFFIIVLCFFLERNFIINKIIGLETEGIVGGKEASAGQFEYQVSIFFNGEFKCGGGLISNNIVLTAAHSFFSDKDGSFLSSYSVSVVASTYNIYKWNESAEEVEVWKVYISEFYQPIKRSEYDGFGAKADLALLKLKRGLGSASAPFAASLELPDQHFAYLNKSFVIAGHGIDTCLPITNPATGNRLIVQRSSGALRFARSSAVRYRDCRQVYYGATPERSLCSRTAQPEHGFPRGVCTGDGGSPLVYKRKIVVAVLSGGPLSCNETEVPAIYTKVANFLPFVSNVLKNKINARTRVFTWRRRTPAHAHYEFVES